MNQRNSRWFSKSIGLTIIILLTVLIGVIVLAYRYGSPDDHILLYVMADDRSLGDEGNSIKVDIRINDDIRYRSVRGDSIPYIPLSPGNYVLRCSAPGYEDFTESIRISPSDSEAYAYCEMQKRAGEQPHEKVVR
ncbi:MAG: peptidase associated/transthyretin-like domain-containing protein [Armatimonadota bacterium]